MFNLDPRSVALAALTNQLIMLIGSQHDEDENWDDFYVVTIPGEDVYDYTICIRRAQCEDGTTHIH